MSMEGGCLCGAVRYQTNAQPAFAGHCYCTSCRKESGGGHVTVAAVPDPTLKITGSTSSYTQPGDSGQPVERTFCSRCGTMLYSRPAAYAGMTLLRAGTLDNPSQVTPSVNIFVRSAVAWDPPSPALPSFPGAPPRGG